MYNKIRFTHVLTILSLVLIFTAGMFGHKLLTIGLAIASGIFYLLNVAFYND